MPKSAAQLDREVKAFLSGSRGSRRDHATIKSPVDLEAFAKATIAAAKKVPEAGRFDDDRVFISSTWLKLPAEIAEEIGSLDAFKVRLVEAQRAGLIRLSRADLVGRMNRHLVAGSAIRVLGEDRFHFIDPT